MRFSVRSTDGRAGGRGSTRPPRRRTSRTPARARRRRRAAGGSATRPGSGPRTGSAIASPGAVRDLRASFVRSPELKIPLRAVASAGSPPIVPRSAWGADESIRRAEPDVRAGDPLRERAPHGGPNDYSPSQAAAIMRGIEIYHVKSNGWNDIGYNFLVDRYGTVYEGRYGGIDRNVIGAYARGFNTGSVGVARDRHVRDRRDPGRGRDVAREAARLAARPRARRSRLARSRSSRAAASATAPAFPSSCAPSPGTATPG